MTGKKFINLTMATKSQLGELQRPTSSCCRSTAISFEASPITYFEELISTLDMHVDEEAGYMHNNDDDASATSTSANQDVSILRRIDKRRADKYIEKGILERKVVNTSDDARNGTHRRAAVRTVLSFPRDHRNARMQNTNNISIRGQPRNSASPNRSNGARGA